MNQEARDNLTKARVALILQQPFFGTLALRLQFVETPAIPTLGVDGKHIFYNPEFINSLTPGQRQTAVAHEIGHCVFDHLSRRGERHPMKWNFAGDFVINEMLKEAGFEAIDGWLLDQKFYGMSADHIYTLLPDPPAGGGYGGKGQPLCDIMSPDGANSPAEAEQAAAEWKLATVQAAAAAKNAGKLPGSLERFVDQIVNGQVDWRAVLRRFITEVSKNDYDWRRFNRKHVANGYYLPALYSENMGTIVVVTDDSGSIDGPTLAAFSAEIAAIRDSARPEKVVHISCDARINHTDEFDPWSPFKLVSKGGGGTDFRPPFDYVAEHGIRPACLVYLTDLYGPAPDSPPEYPVLWCCTTDHVGPWGETVKIKI